MESAIAKFVVQMISEIAIGNAMLESEFRVVFRDKLAI